MWLLRSEPLAASELQMRAALLPLLYVAAAGVELSCQIFDSTMVCDSDKQNIARAEIRTCSG